ncbi:hypothetical protein M407DRAFT_29396 [Tulasnella calospora MUT 4182]|uniref:F-box domain-containing protein n=1 Tax=Tulasnella calospora MUT 4182 TaxID=1051891 RepID=A0A0C3PZJ0_9AGAM|nr:hypothetical protein M407DRAFT_29396 [Tulasnella calospora MUT 4182]
MARLIPAFILKCVFTNLPDELLVEVLALLEVAEILKIRQVCRRLDVCTRDTVLWRRVILRMARDCAISALPSMSRMSVEELEHLAIRRTRAKQRIKEGLSRQIELRTRQVPIRVSSCHLVPGGQWLITSTWAHEVYCWDLDNWAMKEPILLTQPDEANYIEDLLLTAIDYRNSGRCILAVARQRSDGYKIELYSLDFTQSIPRISVLGTITSSRVYGTILISGSYITCVLHSPKTPLIESLNWEQCISRKRFDYTAIIFSLPPPNPGFLHPKTMRSNGLLICNTWKEILVFKLSDFQPVTRLGAIDPTPAAPYWWYTPDDLRIPGWPSPATFSPSDTHLQPSEFCYTEYLLITPAILWS